MVGVLGSGGFGTVYRAVQQPVGREVAVKLIHSQHSRDPEVRARFFREARAVANLDDPTVVTLFDYGDAEGGLYCVFELVEGHTLDRCLEEGPSDPAWVAFVLVQLLGALGEAHERGLVHRDIKPANVMVVERPDGSRRIRLLDFGIAKVTNADADADSVRTKQGMLVGTPEYMSPEQARAKEGIDARSDLYSLGVVAYTLLAGKNPFARKSAIDTLLAHCSTPPGPLDPALDLPEALQRVVAKALEKRPEDRFSSAEQMRRGILAIYPGLDGASRFLPVGSGNEIPSGREQGQGRQEIRVGSGARPGAMSGSGPGAGLGTGSASAGPGLGTGSDPSGTGSAPARSGDGAPVGVGGRIGSGSGRGTACGTGQGFEVHPRAAASGSATAGGESWSRALRAPLSVAVGRPRRTFWAAAALVLLAGLGVWWGSAGQTDGVVSIPLEAPGSNSKAGAAGEGRPIDGVLPSKAVPAAGSAAGSGAESAPADPAAKKAGTSRAAAGPSSPRPATRAVGAEGTNETRSGSESAGGSAGAAAEPRGLGASRRGPTPEPGSRADQRALDRARDRSSDRASSRRRTRRRIPADSPKAKPPPDRTAPSRLRVPEF
ncbi:MAG TPA: serine/threonine-protein kinase [Myxococcales bacterium LLY-WYZ-16_1]|nr:serine/threonine-protein kinase [Myxococcales bacterium LLY-WYZ-16_1]